MGVGVEMYGRQVLDVLDHEDLGSEPSLCNPDGRGVDGVDGEMILSNQGLCFHGHGWHTFTSPYSFREQLVRGSCRSSEEKAWNREFNVMNYGPCFCSQTWGWQMVLVVVLFHCGLNSLQPRPLSHCWSRWFTQWCDLCPHSRGIWAFHRLRLMHSAILSFLWTKEYPCPSRSLGFHVHSSLTPTPHPCRVKVALPLPTEQGQSPQ